MNAPSLLLIAAFALPAAAQTAAPPPLSPATEAVLRRLGLDPASEDVRLAHGAGVITTTYCPGGSSCDAETYSLESLAAANKPNGVRAFITTRAFIHRLSKDFKGTEFPSAYYDALYLTPEERKLAGKKYVEKYLR